MKRWNSMYTNQMNAAAHCEEAACPCAAVMNTAAMGTAVMNRDMMNNAMMNNAMMNREAMICMGTILLVSIFAILGLFAHIHITIIICQMLISLISILMIRSLISNKPPKLKEPNR